MIEIWAENEENFDKKKWKERERGVLVQKLLIHDSRDVEEWIAHSHEDSFARHWFVMFEMRELKDESSRWQERSAEAREYGGVKRSYIRGREGGGGVGERVITGEREGGSRWG